FRPIPLVARETPVVIPPKANKELAAKNLAECIVTDVYKGLSGVEKGSVKYLRVLEQVPRPWGARRFYQPNYMQDEYDQQHVVVSKDTHLGLKIQHGVVTVEEDGSAHFLVPAGRNIFLQALDANFRALQTERTYVNYMQGEVRSCIGCHENVAQTPSRNKQTPKAVMRAAEMPYAQAGEANVAKTLSYARDVQPVWDKHCVSCHSQADSPGKLNLSGTETRLFNESYESLVPERRKHGGVAVKDFTAEAVSKNGGTDYYLNSDGRWMTIQYDRGILGPVIGENHPKDGNIHYLSAKSLGSYASVLVAMLAPDVKLAEPAAQKRAEHLAKVHRNIRLTPTEILQVTNWVDTNCQYYGSYYGRRDIQFKDFPDYRTEYDVTAAVSPDPPASYR
ncbi:MAG: hypothetical protein LBV39_06280, partial [Bacteroidales bacterium]|nr:hypothetical protein [Bacteroidales bacterium]